MGGHRDGGGEGGEGGKERGGGRKVFNVRFSDLCRFGFSTAINGFGYTCTGSEGFISNCTASPFTCITDDADHAIAIECGM